MTASVWRTTGCWGGPALTLLALCALLFHSGVVCDENASAPTGSPHTSGTVVSSADTQTAAVTSATIALDASSANSVAVDPSALALSTASPGVGQTTAPNAPGTPPDAPGTPPNASGTPPDAPGTVPSHALGPVPDADPSHTSVATFVLEDVTIIDPQSFLKSFENQNNPATDGPSQATPAAPSDPVDPVTSQPKASKPDAPLGPMLVVPSVKCVAKEALEGRDTIKTTVRHTSCEETKELLQSLPRKWCNQIKCHLDLYQKKESMEILLASPDADVKTLAAAMKILNDSDIETRLGNAGSSSSSAVFVSVLIAGLLLAAALIGGYCLRRRRGSSGKGMRLAEDSYPVDEENQGNTLVSVAPLTAPADTQQEKPSVNGAETPDAAKTQPPPPTNGHSTAKAPVADTEL